MDILNEAQNNISKTSSIKLSSDNVKSILNIEGTEFLNLVNSQEIPTNETKPVLENYLLSSAIAGNDKQLKSFRSLGKDTIDRGIFANSTSTDIKKLFNIVTRENNQNAKLEQKFINAINKTEDPVIKSRLNDLRILGKEISGPNNQVILSNGIDSIMKNRNIDDYTFKKRLNNVKNKLNKNNNQNEFNKLNTIDMAITIFPKGNRKELVNFFSKYSKNNKESTPLDYIYQYTKQFHPESKVLDGIKTLLNRDEKYKFIGNLYKAYGRNTKSTPIVSNKATKFDIFPKYQLPQEPDKTASQILEETRIVNRETKANVPGRNKRKRRLSDIGDGLNNTTTTTQVPVLQSGGRKKFIGLFER